MSSALTDPVANSICSVTGYYFNFENPDESVFSIYDIAHALSNICRFTGHTRKHYSVAQHSVMVSRIVHPSVALQGLLHDAAEAFLGDVSTPLKRMLPDYKALEKRIEPVVLGRFGIAYPLDPRVKVADAVMLATERRDFMPHLGDEWACLNGVHPLPVKLEAWPAEEARTAFLLRYRELTGYADVPLDMPK